MDSQRSAAQRLSNSLDSFGNTGRQRTLNLKPRRTSFTLVEMLLSASIVVLIMVVLGGVVWSGQRGYLRYRDSLQRETEVMDALEQMTRDLRLVALQAPGAAPVFWTQQQSEDSQ